MSGLRFASALTAFAVCLSMPLEASAAPTETHEVHLVELKLRVCDADYAATGSLIRANLKPGAVTTALDYPRNDFQRGTEFTYVLSLDGVRMFADIQRLEISNVGTDQVCFDRIQLIVNRTPIFQHLGEVRIDFAIAFGYAELRSNRYWVKYQQEDGGYFDTALVNRIVAAGVATGMAEAASGGHTFSWYGTNNPVITRKSSDSFNVHVELEFRRKCVDPFTQTLMDCRMFVFSSDFVLGEACLNGGLGYIQEKTSPNALLISGIPLILWHPLWETEMHQAMDRIADTTAKAFGLHSGCRIISL